MRAATKVSLVASGYLIAVFIAWAVRALYVAATSGPDRQTYGAMFAFGDDLLFLAVFAAAALVPTGAGLFFLRPYSAFWRRLSVVGLAIAASGIAALLVYVAGRAPQASPGLRYLAAVATLRMLLSPLAGALFFLASLFAPTRSPRVALLLTTAAEMTVSLFMVAAWFPASPPR
jgi:hypothetical protein